MIFDVSRFLEIELHFVVCDKMQMALGKDGNSGLFFLCLRRVSYLISPSISGSGKDIVVATRDHAVPFATAK